MKWKDLRVPRGRLITNPYSISNKLDRYIISIEEDVSITNKQRIEYYFQVSYDKNNWSEWVRIYSTSYDFLNEYKLEGLYIRFSIVFVSDGSTPPPKLYSLKMIFKPYSFINNEGSLNVSPKLWIRKRNGKGDIQMINHSTNQILELKNLSNGEEVYIDCENEEIVSSNQSLGVYRYDDHNDEFLELIKGENYITFSGDYDWDIRYKAKLLQE